MNQDLTQTLAARVASAQAEGRPLRIQGGGTKTWLGRAVAGEPLAVVDHRGILSYEPTELVITARAGTPLVEIEAALAERGQWLAFEPPHFSQSQFSTSHVSPGQISYGQISYGHIRTGHISAGHISTADSQGASQGTTQGDNPLPVDPKDPPRAATLGGTIACGLSGPARPYAGAARDFVLGVRIINGKGDVLRFGGEVMKNVAGYDLSRLMAGAQGTLGVLLEVSLKVLPRPVAELTLVFELSPAEAIRRFNDWAGQPLPLSAACHDGERAYIRLAGNEAAVRAAQARLGGEVLGAQAPAGEDRDAADFWRAVRELGHPFFRQGAAPLWRLSLPPTAPLDSRLGSQFIDWGGAQRWVHGEHPLWPVAQAAGGHATCHGLKFGRVAHPDSAEAHLGPAVSTADAVNAGHAPRAVSPGSREREPAAIPEAEVFQPLPLALLALHRRLKAALDPRGILNPGRIYPEL